MTIRGINNVAMRGVRSLQMNVIRGRIEPDEARGMFVDLVGARLDDTATALGVLYAGLGDLASQTRSTYGEDSDPYRVLCDWKPSFMDQRVDRIGTKLQQADVKFGRAAVGFASAMQRLDAPLTYTSGPVFQGLRSPVGTWFDGASASGRATT